MARCLLDVEQRDPRDGDVVNGPRQSFRLTIDGGIQIAHGSQSKILDAISRTSQHRYYIRDAHDPSFVVTLTIDPPSVVFTRHGTSVAANDGFNQAAWLTPMLRTLAAIHPNIKEMHIP